MKQIIDPKLAEEAFDTITWDYRHDNYNLNPPAPERFKKAALSIILHARDYTIKHLTKIKKDASGMIYWKERSVTKPYDDSNFLRRLLPGMGHVRVKYFFEGKERTFVIPDVNKIKTGPGERAVIETLSGKRITCLKSCQMWDKNSLQSTIDRPERALHKEVVLARRRERQKSLFGTVSLSSVENNLKNQGFNPEKVLEVIGREFYGPRLVGDEKKYLDGRIKVGIKNNGKNQSQGLYICLTDRWGNVVREGEFDWYQEREEIKELFSPSGYWKFQQENIALHLRKEIQNLATSLEYNEGNMQQFIKTRDEKFTSKQALYCDFIEPGIMVFYDTDKKGITIIERQNVRREEKHSLGKIWDERQIHIPANTENMERLKFLVPEHVVENLDQIEKPGLQKLPELIFSGEAILKNPETHQNMPKVLKAESFDTLAPLVTKEQIEAAKGKEVEAKIKAGATENQREKQPFDIDLKKAAALLEFAKEEPTEQKTAEPEKAETMQKTNVGKIDLELAGKEILSVKDRYYEGKEKKTIEKSGFSNLPF